MTVSRPRHILHVIDALDHGGAQQFLVLLAEGVDADCFSMTVCVLQPDLEMKGVLEARGVKVFCCGRKRPSMFQPARFISYVFRNIRDIATFCRMQGVDVVQCHLSDSEFLGVLAARIAGVERVFTTVHYPALLPDRLPGDLRNLLRRLWTRIIYHCWTDKVVAVSEEIADRLVHDFGISPKRVRVILNGINVSVFSSNRPETNHLRQSLGISDGDQVIVNVARLTPPKGQVFLLDAMAILRKRSGQITLLMVGDGELRQMLEAQSVRLHLQDRVRFLGNRSDVADILALSDLFAFPSLSEGTSLALLEAMAAGKPVVATAIPGNQRVLQHQKTGYLVSAGSAAKLAEGIAHVLDQPEQARTYGQCAQQVVREHFDIRLTIAQYQSMWGGSRVR
jgi:L-malate glycosyltransferase